MCIVRAVYWGVLRGWVSFVLPQVLLWISFLAPHINNVYFSMLVTKHGTYKVVYGLLLLKLALASTMIVAGSESWILLCLFVASNRIFTEGEFFLIYVLLFFSGSHKGTCSPGLFGISI